MSGYVCRAAGRFPGVLSQGASRVRHVPAGAADKMGGVSGGSMARMNVGDDLHAAVAKLLPLLPCAFQEAEVLRTVNSGAGARAKAVGNEDVVPLPLHCLQEALGSLRLFGARLGNSTHQEKSRVVEAVLRVVNDFHGRPSPVEAAWERRSRKSARTSCQATVMW